MAAHSASFIRVRLHFDYPPPAVVDCRMCWLLVDLSACRVVADLESVIRHRFEFSARSILSLFVEDCYLPHTESIFVVRDNDSVRVKVDSAAQVNAHSGGPDASSKHRRKRPRPAEEEVPEGNGVSVEVKKKKRKKRSEEEEEGEERAETPKGRPAEKKRNKAEAAPKPAAAAAASGKKVEAEQPAKSSKRPPAKQHASSSDSSSSSEEDEAPKKPPAPKPGAKKPPTPAAAPPKAPPAAKTKPRPPPSSSSDSSSDSSSSSDEAPAKKVPPKNKPLPPGSAAEPRDSDSETGIKLFIHPPPRPSDAALPLGRGGGGGGRGRRGAPWAGPGAGRGRGGEPRGVRGRGGSSGVVGNGAEEPRYETDSLTNTSLVLQNGAESTPKRDYSSMPLLAAPPQVGQKIAFKLLELAENYTPEISEYKEGKIVSFDPTTKQIELELLHAAQAPVEPGKFDLVYENPDGSARVEYAVSRGAWVTEQWDSLLEPRLLT